MKTNSFEYIYNAGGIPCRIDHGSVNNRLKWNSEVNLEELSFDPLLVTCFEGLIEEAHPYSFIAKEAIREMLESKGAAEKAIPLLSKLAFPLRSAFSHRSSVVFGNALTVLKCLSNTVNDALDDILNSFLAQIARKLNDKTLREKVAETLHTVEQNGGPNVIKIIKTKVPTYTSVV